MLLDMLLGPRCRACRRRTRHLQRLGAVAPTHPGAFDTSRFVLVHCPRCDVVYLDPAPTSHDLHVLYEESVQFSDAHYTEPGRVAKILEYYGDAVRRLDLLPTAGERMLEVGAGLAWVARACKAAEPGVLTVAQDVSAECADACDWVDRYHVGELSALDRDGSFRLASMTHVIEHLVDPARMLDDIATRLAPGGKLFVTAPYRPSGWQAGDGLAGWNEYSYLHVPAHVTYFSRAWFVRETPHNRLQVVHWDASHEDGQAFELVLQKN
jgi:2-polyprenyl-3-methyl-5-hydroxy-6-metoxy-1,4-benzoquinol methylase